MKLVNWPSKVGQPDCKWAGPDWARPGMDGDGLVEEDRTANKGRGWLVG